MIALTNAQYAGLIAKLDRIAAELLLRQPIDANILKRLSDLESAVAAIRTAGQNGSR